MAKKRRAPRSGVSMRSLRTRLRDAEETLGAIRDGHIDALVMRAPDGERVYTLRTADQPYRLMVEQMHEGALTLSADGTVLYCNARFGELLGQPSIAIVGQPFPTFVVPADRGRIQTLLESATFRDEYHLLTKDGPIPTQLSATAIDIEDTRTLAVVVSDLTPERTERALRESNRLKDEFLATLSHELRTPVNVILGWTRMLLTDQLSPATRRRALELVDKNAQAQAQIVADLIDMSRITCGKLSLDVMPLAVPPALQAAIDSVRFTAAAKGVSLQTMPGADDELVLADATRLQQVLWNLLSNAVKFTSPGGHIRVSAEREGNWIRFEVTDSGIGIDPRFLPHVFDRFRQAESGTTRTYGGLGLGLSVVHDIVLFHGGTVKARSAGLGRGATFIVRLPRADRQTPEGSVWHRLGSHPHLDGSVIVLIENHDDTRDLTTQILKQAGVTVWPCTSAAEAFSILSDRHASAIIADIGLPDEDGISFIARVRRHPSPAVRNLPAIALTAYTSPSEQEHALKAGFQRHIAKPVDPVYLIDVLSDMLGDRPQATAPP